MECSRSEEGRGEEGRRGQTRFDASDAAGASTLQHFPSLHLTVRPFPFLPRNDDNHIRLPSILADDSCVSELLELDAMLEQVRCAKRPGVVALARCAVTRSWRSL